MKNIYLFAGFVLLGLLNPLSAFAEGDNSGFESHKANMLKRIDERMAKLTEHRSCVAASANHDAIKACHDKMRAWMQEQRDEHMDHGKGPGNPRKPK